MKFAKRGSMTVEEFTKIQSDFIQPSIERLIKKRNEIYKERQILEFYNGFRKSHEKII